MVERTWQQCAVYLLNAVCRRLYGTRALSESDAVYIDKDGDVRVPGRCAARIREREGGRAPVEGRLAQWLADSPTDSVIMPSSEATGVRCIDVQIEKHNVLRW